MPPKKRPHLTRQKQHSKSKYIKKKDRMNNINNGNLSISTTMNLQTPTSSITTETNESLQITSRQRQCTANAIFAIEKRETEIKIKSEIDDSPIMEDEKCHSFNQTNTFMEIKNEIDIEDTLLLNENKFVTNAELKYNIKKECSSMEVRDDTYEQDIEAENGTPIDATSASAKLIEVRHEFCDYASSISYSPAAGRTKNSNIPQKSKTFKCEYCDYAASLPQHLRVHIKSVHLKTKDFTCTYCNYSASLSSTLKIHIKSVHHKINDFKCEYCDYSASRAQHIKTHMKLVHLKIKDFKCKYCVYSASMAQSVKTHIKSVHLKIKDIKCQYCNYSASQTSHLKKHIKSVHQNIKEFKCEYCDYSASQAHNLKIHVKSAHHTIYDYKCEYCDYSASTTQNLKTHVKSVHREINACV